MLRTVLEGRSPKAVTVAAVAVLGATALFGGCANSGSVASTTTAPSAAWNGNGAPPYLVTPATGTNITAAARNTSFICPDVLAGISVTSNNAPRQTSLTAGTAPWVSGNHVNLSRVPAVPGSLHLKSVFHVTVTGNSRVLTGNGIPSTPVGIFPIPSTSAAYSFYAALPAIGYPNAAAIPIAPYALQATLPLHPEVNATPTCIGGLATAITLTGAVWHAEIAPDSKGNVYNPDSVLPLDACQGHPYMGQYHYHGYSWKCFPAALQGTPGEQSPLVGYALDGFGVYGPRGANGQPVTNAQLDVCHGMTSKVWFNGKYQRVYHYVLNNEYPYSIGCFRGTPVQLPASMTMPGMTMPAGTVSSFNSAGPSSTRPSSTRPSSKGAMASMSMSNPRQS